MGLPVVGSHRRGVPTSRKFLDILLSTRHKTSGIGVFNPKDTGSPCDAQQVIIQGGSFTPDVERSVGWAQNVLSVSVASGLISLSVQQSLHGKIPNARGCCDGCFTILQR